MWMASFTLLLRNSMIYFILGAMNALILLIFEKNFVYWNISLVGETVSPVRLFTVEVLELFYENLQVCFMLLNARVYRSNWTSPFIPPIWGERARRIMDKNAILIFHEHGCWQPFRPEVPWNILHIFHWSMSPTVSVQGNCRSVYSNNSKGENNLGWIIIQYQSVSWWTGNQEEGLLGV